MTDYHDFTDIDTPKEERRKINVGDIYINAIECTHCGDIPRSKNRHDMCYCKCGKVAVDGGSWYGRIACQELTDFIDRSVPYNDI